MWLYLGGRGGFPPRSRHTDRTSWFFLRDERASTFPLLPGVAFPRGETADTVADLIRTHRCSVITFPKGVSDRRMTIFQDRLRLSRNILSRRDRGRYKNYRIRGWIIVELTPRIASGRPTVEIYSRWSSRLASGSDFGDCDYFSGRDDSNADLFANAFGTSLLGDKKNAVRYAARIRDIITNFDEHAKLFIE